VKVLHNTTNLKLPASLNCGFAASTCSSYLTWTSDDNVLHPAFLSTLLSELKASGSELIYSDFNVIDEEGNFVTVSHMGAPEELVYANSIGASFLYRREIHETLGGYDPRRFLYEDYDFWVRTYLAGFRMVHSLSVVYDYRQHKNSLRAGTTKTPAG